MAHYPATTIANEFLRHAAEDGESITHMKLQKLVYLAHGFYLAISGGDPLIKEKIRAWKYGPVINEMYAAFSKYGGEPVQKPYKTYAVQDGKIGFVAAGLDDDDEDELANAVVHRVWSVYGNRSAIELSAMTHRPGSPYRTAVSQGRRVIPRQIILDNFKELAIVP